MSAENFFVDLYYIAFPNDKKITKAIFALVYSIDTAQTILALLDFYQLFCTSDNDLEYLLETTEIHPNFIWLTIPLSSTSGTYI